MNSLKQRLIAVLLILCLVGCMPAEHSKAAETETFRDNKNGTVTITFNNDDESTILILSENTTTGSTAKRYYYKLYKGENVVDIPMTEGAGVYKFRICRVRSDGKAVVLKSAEVELTEENAGGCFEKASMVVDYGVSDTFIKKAKSLTRTCKTESAKVKKIYKYIIKNFAYDYEQLSIKTKTSYYVPDLKSTFTRKLGICYDISCTFAAMLRAVGVEAKVVTGNTPNVKEYHAWNQVYDSKNDIWYTVDCTYDMCRYAKDPNPVMKKADSLYKDIVYTY